MLAYIPGLANWYSAKDTIAKARVMGGLLILVAVVIYALACAHIIADLGLAVACTKTGFLQLAQILLAAFIANQATFLLAVKPFKR